MDIVLLEPYFTGSHRAWAWGLAKHSRHRVRILSLSGHFWKWRMHGGAITLARMFLDLAARPDLILATDMLDLTTFLALTRERTADLPVAVYFHENQLTYPWSPQDRDLQRNRDRHYGFINFATALSADAVFFNSEYHRRSFLHALPKFLHHFPDYQELPTVEQIKTKSEVLPLGLDLRRLDELKGRYHLKRSDRPLLLWNHRWEYDKNPEEFFEALRRVAENRPDFDVAVLGQRFSLRPTAFARAREELNDQIRHWGYTDNTEEYAAWLWRADLLPVTSHQDFFGASVLEAVYCRTFPLLPKRLAYPELIPPIDFPGCYYDDLSDLVRRIETRLSAPPPEAELERLRQRVAQYDWAAMAARYDTRLEELVQNRVRAAF